MAKDKVIVTGGCGFIGSNLTKKLFDLGYDVHVVDDYSTYEGLPLHFPNQVVLGANIKESESDPDMVTIHKMDIRDGVQELYKVFRNSKYVFHLAARPRVEQSIQDPVTFHDVNVNGSLNVFLAAKKAQVQKVIFSSTSAVLGDAKTLPTPEDMPSDPLSPYAAHKLIGEVYLQLFFNLFKLNSVALRYFNAYGYRQPTEGPYVPIMGIFKRLKNEGKPLTITGDGLQSRDFVNVRDICDANILAATRPETDEGFHVFNIGNGKDYKILDIAKKIGGEIKHIDPRFEPRKTLCDNSKAKKMLGWEPKCELFKWIEENI
tara:strand:- start:14782 stop:15735 length:954 start_codon:yes stop_codon:yes gene_type:complete